MGTLNQASPRIAAIYERLVDLKNEHYVGSAAAFAHIRSELAAEELRDQLSQELKLSPRPPVRAIIQLCDRAMELVEHLVRISAIKEELVSEIDVLPLGGAARSPSSLSFEYAKPFVIELDYNRLLLKFFSDPHKGRIPDEQLLFMVAFKLLSHERILSGFLPGGVIRHRCNLRQLLEMLSSDEERGDEVTQHARESAAERLEQLVNTPLAATSTSELLTFYDYRNLYKRAEHERILGYIEVEREIARSYLFQFSEAQRLAPQELLEHAIVLARRIFEASKARLVRIQELDAPDSMIKFEKNLVARMRYTYLALLKNRNWLLRYLQS